MATWIKVNSDDEDVVEDFALAKPIVRVSRRKDGSVVARMLGEDEWFEIHDPSEGIAAFARTMNALGLLDASEQA